MDAKAFKIGLQALSVALPFAKRIHEDEAAFLWMALEQQVKSEVSNQMWAYAVGRRLSEPDPPKEMALHLSALRHVYRCENGMPNLKWGLKPQVAQNLLEAA